MVVVVVGKKKTPHFDYHFLLCDDDRLDSVMPDDFLFIIWDERFRCLVLTPDALVILLEGCRVRLLLEILFPIFADSSLEDEFSK